MTCNLNRPSKVIVLQPDAIGNGMKHFKVKPVTKETWKDFETLFESKGAPKYCWCMAWRSTPEELKVNDSSHRKTYIRKRVNGGTPIGLLAYEEREPVAWCSVAPRETYRRLDGDESLDGVWSVTCFFIKREYRKSGLTAFLIREAKKYAKKNGARYLEAYPVENDSPSYRFMGFLSMFEKSDFTFVKKAGLRRHVMVHKL